MKTASNGIKRSPNKPHPLDIVVHCKMADTWDLLVWCVGHGKGVEYCQGPLAVEWESWGNGS